MRPWELARLTDWQLERLYRRPIERRNAEMAARSHTGGGNGPAPAPAAPAEDAAAGARAAIEAGGAPSRASMVALLRLFGMTTAEAHAEYDRQLAEHQKAQRKG